MRTDSAGYKLDYLHEDLDLLPRSTATLDVNGVINGDSLITDLHLQSSYAYDRIDQTSKTTIMDGGLRYSSSHTLSLDAGKRVQRWGKGYAWNPVAFIERSKDPGDPQTIREGYLMASIDWVKSFDSRLTTLGVTAVAVPVFNRVNDDFGSKSHANPALKIYMLIDNTDIDLLWRAAGSRAQAIGVDFSRNLLENLAIHGEWARNFDAPYNYLDTSATINSETRNSNSYLLGMRYLSTSDITWIAEYYHNGRGYSHKALENYYQFIDDTLDNDAGVIDIAQAISIANSGYGKSTPGRDYAYLRITKSEPFNWLYISSALTTLINLNDNSYQITPELTYNGVNNLEIRARMSITEGEPDSDYGEKKSARKYELYGRYFF